MPAHKDLTGSDLHEPKGVATAAAGTVYTANGNGSGSWQPIVIPEPPTPNILVESNTQLPVSAKGSTIVSDGANWPVVPIGEEGQVLTVSESTTTGVEWKTLPTASAPSSIGPVIQQEAHGFSTGTAVYFDGTDWKLAMSDSSVTIGSHVVEEIDEDSFKAVICGVIGGMSGLTPGEWYLVSDTTPGVLTTTPPVSGFSNPVGQALSATELMVLSYRAQEIV